MRTSKVISISKVSRFWAILSVSVQSIPECQNAKCSRPAPYILAIENLFWISAWRAFAEELWF